MEGVLVGVEDHLLRLARVGSQQEEPDMGHLDRRGDAGEPNALMAPVELVGLTRSPSRAPRLIVPISC